MLPNNPIPSVINYGSSATYKDLPTPEQVAAGVIPLDSLPAAWWNAMWACNNVAFNCSRTVTGQLINEINTVLTQASVSPDCTCTDQLYQAITKLRRIVGDSTYPGAVKSSSCPGEVSIDQYGVMTANCVGNASNLNTTCKVIVGAINELKTTYDNCWTDNTTALSGKAPTSHASTGTTYGVGTSSKYGHLKISDTYTSTLTACSGVAASQCALAAAYSAITEAGYTTLGNTAGCALGTAAAGTATTAARSDHVHAKPTQVTCACCTYRCLATADTTRQILLGAATESNGFGLVYVGNSCKATFNPGTGVLTATTFCGTASCATSAKKIDRCSYTSAYNFDVLLTNNCTTATGTVPFVSACCRLQFCNTTGVLTAKTFCGNATTATKACCAISLYNRPASGTANATCSVYFCTGCTNAECTATNFTACINGSNGWMYGLKGLYSPYVRANDPGCTASKVCNVAISAYCTNAECTKTTSTFTFCGSTGYMHGNVCGNVCGKASKAGEANWACYADNAAWAGEANCACTACCATCSCTSRMLGVEGITVPSGLVFGWACAYSSATTVCICNNATCTVIVQPASMYTTCWDVHIPYLCGWGLSARQCATFYVKNCGVTEGICFSVRGTQLCCVGQQGHGIIPNGCTCLIYRANSCNIFGLNHAYLFLPQAAVNPEAWCICPVPGLTNIPLAFAWDCDYCE